MRINKAFAKWLFCAAMVLPFGVSAQVNGRTGTEDTLKTNILTVFDYRPTISAATKISERPSAIDTVPPVPVVRYAFLNRQYKTLFVADSVSPAKMKGEPLSPLYRGYARAGIGNGINTLGDLYINSLRSREGAFGLEVHHFGTEGNLSGVAQPAPYNNQEASFYGKKFTKAHAIGFDVFYERERVQYYGFSDTNVFYYNKPEEDFRQVYQEAGMQLTAKSFYDDSTRINQDAKLDYAHFWDLSNRENNLRAQGRFNRFFGRHEGIAQLTYDLNDVRYSAPVSDLSVGFRDDNKVNSIVGLLPMMVMRGDKYQLEFGPNVQMQFERNRSDVILSPHVYAKYNLVRDIIIPYAGWDGGYVRNSLQSLTELNPFLSPGHVALRNSRKLYEAYAGFRGAFSSRITFNVQASRAEIQDNPLFVNMNASVYNFGTNAFGENYFVVAYDTLEIVRLSGELNYQQSEKLQLLARGEYNAYNTRRELEAWHMPSLRLGLHGYYDIQDKIIARASVFYVSGQWAKTLDSLNSDKFFGSGIYGHKVKGYFDANLGVEYRYTEKLSAFLQLNNIAASRYMRWYNYPSQRFNVLAGITYSFWKP